MALKRMKTLTLESKQAPFKRADIELVRPGPGEVLVKTTVSALNHLDWKIQKYGVFVEQYPAILGVEGAGIVEDLGEGVDNVKYGEKVFYQGFLQNKFATFQQYTIVPAELLGKIPSNISFQQAATIPLGAGTAAVGLYNPPEQGGLGLTAPWDPSGKGKYTGESILVIGGASAVGQYAIQFAKLSGFSKIVTTASPSNSDLLTALGATDVLDRHNTTSSNGSFSCVFDTIATPETQSLALSSLSPSGSAVLTMPLDSSLSAKVGNRHVTNVFGLVHAHRALGAKLFSNLTGYLESGEIRPMAVKSLDSGVESGLNSIVKGLAMLEKGEVSATKLVVGPQVTIY